MLVRLTRQSAAAAGRFDLVPSAALVLLMVGIACGPANVAPTVVELLPRDAADDLVITLAPAIDPATMTTNRLGDVGGREVFASTHRGSGSTRTVLSDRSGSNAPLRPLLEVVLEDGLFGGGGAELVAAADHTFLVIRVDVPGTGNFNQDVALHWNGGRWQQIDANRWLSEFTLPACYEIWKGGRADLNALRGASAVWVAGDPNCCPSGGDVNAELEVRDRALRIRTQASRLAELDALRKDPARVEALRTCEAGTKP